MIIDRPGLERAATAGRSDLARRLPMGRWLGLLDTIEMIASLAKQHGLQPAFHPHAGSYIEFPDEIDRLIADSDIGLCLDTGHAMYAGIAAHDAIRAYGPRIVHVHLKDVDPRVLERVRRERVGFWAAIGLGVFCPLGRGAVDLSLVATALDQIGYRGFATVEQDRVPGSGSPLRDLHKAVTALEQAGLWSSPAHDSRVTPQGRN